jgi:hypothetical protein
MMMLKIPIKTLVLWLFPAILTFEAAALENRTESKQPKAEIKQSIIPDFNSLPSGFEQYSTTEVLKTIFSDYDADTGKTTQAEDAAHKPLNIMLIETIEWHILNQQVLWVLVGIESEQTRVESSEPEVIMCNACFSQAGLALLENTGKHLKLRAYTKLKFGRNNTNLGFFHFDHSQYLLSESEPLLAIRRFSPGPGYGSDELMLLRITGSAIHQVFEHEMTEIYQTDDGLFAGKLICLSVANQHDWNDLLIKSKSGAVDLPVEDEEIPETKSVTTEPVKEFWRFNGEEFQRLK